MAIEINGTAVGVGDVDPADVDSSDTMRGYVDGILTDLRVIRRFVRKVKAAQSVAAGG